MKDKLLRLFRPRSRGIHIKRNTVLRIIVLAFFITALISAVIGFYELYRVKQVRIQAAEEAVALAEAKKIKAVQLTEAKGPDDIIGKDYKIVYLDPDKLPQEEDRIEISLLKSHEYRARRTLSKGIILTKNDIIRTDDWLPDEVKLRQYKDKITIPEETSIGEIVDVVLTRNHPDGTYEEFVVLSDKKIRYLNGSTIKFDMRSDLERYLMGRAITEVMYGTEYKSAMHLDHYIDPELQGQARVTYLSTLEESDSLKQLLESSDEESDDNNGNSDKSNEGQHVNREDINVKNEDQSIINGTTKEKSEVNSSASDSSTTN